MGKGRNSYAGNNQMDIVKRLREGRTNGTELRWDVTDVHREAADEIERLREENERLRLALAPIVPCDKETIRRALADEQKAPE